MQSELSLSPLRVMDAQRLRSAGILHGKLQDVSEHIREMISDSHSSIYLASDSADTDKNPIALIIYSQIHPVHKNAYVEVLGAGDFKARSLDAVDAMLRLAFFTLQLHRVSVLIPVYDHAMAEVLMTCGMVQEAVLDEALCIDGVFQDAGLFSLLASEYPDYGVAFVAYPQGVISVRGGTNTVEGIRFYHYTEEIVDPYERLVAIRTGIADSDGKLCPSGSPVYANGYSNCPDEIVRAAKELKEYFSKSRTNFTVNIHFPFGSDFQRHVWSELQKIPYGSTVSYEDVAMALTGNDKIAARNLSRAVGSACAENPIPILVPCHRVIGKNGRLVGFSGGVENKEFLLEHEIFGFFREIPKKQ